MKAESSNLTKQLEKRAHSRKHKFSRLTRRVTSLLLIDCPYVIILHYLSTRTSDQG